MQCPTPALRWGGGHQKSQVPHFRNRSKGQIWSLMHSTAAPNGSVCVCAPDTIPMNRRLYPVNRAALSTQFRKATYLTGVNPAVIGQGTIRPMSPAIYAMHKVRSCGGLGRRRPRRLPTAIECPLWKTYGVATSTSSPEMRGIFASLHCTSQSEQRGGELQGYRFRS